MNIFAGPGDKVRYTNLTWGGDNDIAYATEKLVREGIYTVKKVHIYSSSSTVWFEEVNERRGFNTVMFEDVKVDEVRADKIANIFYTKFRYSYPFDTSTGRDA